MARRTRPPEEEHLEAALRSSFMEAMDAAIAELRAKRMRAPYFAARRALTVQLVANAVLYCGGDKRRAAKWLGISYSTIKQFR